MQEKKRKKKEIPKNNNNESWKSQILEKEKITEKEKKRDALSAAITASMGEDARIGPKSGVGRVPRAVIIEEHPSGD